MKKTSIAKRYLKHYRFLRSCGYNVAKARGHALFSATCGKGGAACMLMQNHARRFSAYWAGKHWEGWSNYEKKVFGIS